MKNVSFGDLVAKERERKNLSLQQLAKLTQGKIAPSYINRLEKNERRSPSFEVVCELTKALDLNIMDVFASFNQAELLTSLIHASQDEQQIILKANEKVADSANKQKFIEKIMEAIVQYVEADDEDQYGYLGVIVDHLVQVRKQ